MNFRIRIGRKYLNSMLSIPVSIPMSTRVNARVHTRPIARLITRVSEGVNLEVFAGLFKKGLGLFASALLSMMLITSAQASQTTGSSPVKFTPIPTQFIAALGDPGATSGVGAQDWGYWHSDPGKTGVWLSLFPVLKATGGYAPGNWQFDETDWWLDENGLIMQKPVFEIEPGKYIVTGEREVTTTLTVHAKDDQGVQRWELADKATLHDVTHMPCRSARYTPLAGENNCSPSNADISKFKVAPGSIMPDIPGCKRLDYSVLIVIGRIDHVASK